MPNLLRPEQVLETKSEVSRIEGMLNDPKGAVQDKPAAIRQLQSMNNMLETQTPKEYDVTVKDAAARREVELREGMVADGMPTQTEMRSCPPGAVNKLLVWESRNKKNLSEWKHITQRLNAGSQDPDLANFEKYRPHGGAQELSMDNAVIAPKTMHLPPAGAGPVSVMSEAEHEVLKQMDPEIADMMALASNDQRSQILKAVREVMVAEQEAPKKPKRKLSEEHLAKLAAGRDKAKAKKTAVIARASVAAAGTESL